MTTPECRIEVMGSLRVLRGGQTLTHFRTHKTGALLAYLAVCADRPARREELIELFWPDNDLDSGRNCLRIALSALKRMLSTPQRLSTPTPRSKVIKTAAAQDGAIAHTCEDASVSPDPLLAVSASVLIADRASVRLDPAAFTTDKAEFEGCLRSATRAPEGPERIAHLKRALTFYGGDLLPGYDEHWVVRERARLADQQQLALRRLAALLVKEHDAAGALDYVHRAVEADPLCQEAQRMLIQLYAGMGRHDAALRQYQTLERLLAQHLRVRPSAQLRAFVAELDTRGPDADISARPAIATLTSPAPISNIAPASPSTPFPRDATPPLLREGSLPVPYSRFFGREDSLAAVLEMADTPHTRLITLTGLGGSGKTRLALQVGERLRDAMQGAVWFVPLAHLSDPERILDAIADAVSPAVRAAPAAHNAAPPDAQIVRALGSAPALLILDNFEHLADRGAALIPPLLESLPGLVCLVTSRRRLNLSGEYEYAVQPLPTPHSAGTPDRLLEFASVQLFVDRARAVRSEFVLTRENAPDVAALCHHLEGVPLAIELAAAYAQVLTPAQILARARKRLPLLVSRSKDAPARHASLRAALDWSWQLLDPSLQRVFACLSVLRGGWTLDAACAIVAEASAPPAAFTPENAFAGRGSVFFDPFPDDDTLTGAFPDAAPHGGKDALDALTELRERSLIQAEETGREMRYQMLETLREFAGEQMDAACVNAARARHSAFFLNLALTGEPHLIGPDAGTWLNRLQSDRDNLRAALHYLLRRACNPPASSAAPGLSAGADNDHDGLLLASALWRFWYMRGQYAEGQEWLQKALAGPASCAAPAPMRLKALRGLGNLALAQGDLTLAQTAFEEHRTLAEAAGGREERAASAGSLAHVLHQRGDLTRARALLQDSLALFREAGEERGIALTLANLAVAMQAQGQHTVAAEMHRESLHLFRNMGDTQNIILALNNLAYVYYINGDYAEARGFLVESLTLARASDNYRGCALALNTLAALAFQRNCSLQAAVLLGQVAILIQQLQLPAGTSLHVDFRRECERVRAAVGEREFNQRAVNARELSLEQLLCIVHELPA